MHIDLHAHSLRSDGTDTPTELIEAAKAAGLDVVAITDHDNTNGWAEAEETAARVGIELVKGVEMSTAYRGCPDHPGCLLHPGCSVHLLGYRFNREDPVLKKEFLRSREARDERVDKILAKLRFHDLDRGITREDVERIASGSPIGKPHFHRALVENGLVPPTGETTYKELLSGGVAYVERTYSLDLVAAIGMIADAGGCAVIAHPWRDEKGRAVLTRDVFFTLKDAGLWGIEVTHPNHTIKDRAELEAIAKEVGLAVTGGSDYHGKGKELPKFSLRSCTTDQEQYNNLLSWKTSR